MGVAALPYQGSISSVATAMASAMVTPRARRFATERVVLIESFKSARSRASLEGCGRVAATRGGGRKDESKRSGVASTSQGATTVLKPRLRLDMAQNPDTRFS